MLCACHTVETTDRSTHLEEVRKVYQIEGGEGKGREIMTGEFGDSFFFFPFL